MAEGTRVGTAHISIFADDSPYRRRMATIGRGVREKVKVAVEADERSFRQSFENMTRRGGKVKVDVDVEGEGQLTTLQAFLLALKDKRVRVDVDSRPAVRAAAAITSGIASASSSIDRFNRTVYTMGNVLTVVARSAILGLVAAIAPLIGVLTVASAGAVALAGGFGLILAAALPSIAALTNHKTASEQAAAASEQLEAAEESLADAEENLARTVVDSNRAVADAAQAREDAAENARRTELQTAEDIADANRAVADARRDYDEAVRQSAQDNAEAERAYVAALRNREQVERDNAERLREAYAAAREADQEYTRIVQENTRRLRDARRELIDLQREYAELQRENAEEEQEQLEAISDAREDLAETIEDQNERVADAYENAADAAEDVADGEENLADTREDLKDATEDLREAQEDLNDAMRDEALVQAQIANDAEGAAIAYQQQAAELAALQQQYQDAVAAGDTITAGELELDILEAQNDLEAAAIASQQAQNELTELQEEGASQQLQDAQSAVEAAYQAVQDQEEQVQDARERLRDLRVVQQEAEAAVLEAIKDRDEAIAVALERIREERQALQDLREENAREEQDALRRIREQQQEIARTIQENAQREREAAAERLAARRTIRQVEAENRAELRQAQREINASILEMRETERRGNEVVAESERSIAEAIRQRRRATRQARWDVEDAMEGLAASQAAYAQSLEDRRQRIADARDDIDRARDDVRGAAKEADEAAESFGAKLTASQQALLAAAISFRDSFLTAFRPAMDAFNYLAVSVLAFAQQGLPYFGSIAAQSVEGLRKAFESIRKEILNPEQLATFRGFFDRVPEILRVATTALGDFLIGIFNILAEGLPTFEAGLAKVAGWFDSLLRWTQSEGGKRALQSFFEDASHFAGILADVLADVAKFLFRIGTSDQMKGIFENISRFVSFLAENPEGVIAALWVIRRLGQAIMFILELPYAGKAIGFVGGLAAVLLLFAGPAIALAIGAISAFSTVLWALTGRGLLSRLAGRGGLIGILRNFARGGILDDIALRFLYAGDAIRGFVRTLGRQLSRAPRVVLNALRGIPRLVGQIFGGLPAQAARGVGQLLRFVGRQFARIPRLVWNGLRGIGRMVAQVFGNLVSWASRGIGRLLTFVGRQIGRVPRIIWNAIRGIPRFFGRIFGSLPGIALRALQGVGRAIMGVLRGVGRWFSPLTRFVGGRGVLFRLFAGLARWLPRLVSVAFGPIGWVIQGAIEGAILNIRYFLDDFIPNVAVPGLNMIPEILSNPFARTPVRIRERMIESLKRWPMMAPIITAVDAAVDWLASALPNIASWIGETVGSLGKWIGNAFDGLVEGLVAGVERLWDWLKQVGQQAWDYLSSFWEMASPSKRMKRLGRSIADGLTEGIKEGSRNALREAQRMSDGVNRGLSGMGGDIVLDTRPVNTGNIQREVYGQLSIDLGRLERQIERLTGRPIELTSYLTLDGREIDSRVLRVSADELREGRREMSRRNAFSG